ncbi:MAG: amino acid-binding protein [Candidatus Micrarchaeia archaeon]
MWKRVAEKFADFPARIAVARKIVECGLRVAADGRVLCGDVEVKEVSLAKAAGVDRRAVSATVGAIVRDRELARVFENILPAGGLLKNVAHLLGFGVVEIEAQASKGGIIAAASTLLAKSRISIRQLHAEDPELFENPKMTIITERPVPGKLLNEFLKIRGVTKVSVS